MLRSSRLIPKLLQSCSSQYALGRTQRGINQLAEKVSPHEYSKTHHQLEEFEYQHQESCSLFAKEIQKIFPAAKSSPYEKAIKFLESTCSSVAGYQPLVARSLDFAHAVPMKDEVYTNGIMNDLLKDLPEISPGISSTLLDYIENHVDENGVYAFFVDKSMKLDVDTTSVCLMPLLHGNRIEVRDATEIARILTLNTNQEGVVELFIPSKSRPAGRLGVCDQGCLSNMMRLLYHLNLESKAKGTEDFIFNHISKSNSFKEIRSKHYPAECLLYFLSNSLKYPAMRKRFETVLIKRLVEGLGNSTNELALAQRIIVAHNLGFLDGISGKEGNSRISMGPGKFEELKREVKLLRSLQNEATGGWNLPGNEFYRCSRYVYGSEAIVTAFATRALYFSQDIRD